MSNVTFQTSHAADSVYLRTGSETFEIPAL